MKKTAALFLVLSCLSAALSADEKRMAPLIFPSASENGLGGAHVAYSNNFYSLFVNPAALQWTNEGSILETSFAITGPLDKFAKSGPKLFSAFEDVGDGFGGSGVSNPFDPLLDIIDGGKLPLGLDIRGPLSLGYVANGLGFGLFSRTFVDARIIGINFSAMGYQDIMLPFGMSANVLRLKDHELAAGFVLKPYVRALADLRLNALDMVGDQDILKDTPIPLLAGLGSNLGLLYRFKRDLAAGLTMDDLYTFGVKMADINGKTDSLFRVPLSLNWGLSYTFRVANFWEAAPKALQSAYAAAMLDWRSFNNVFTWNDRIHRNPILDLGLGLELGFFNFLKLRMGLRDMLPSIGLGLEPRVFKFNIALYGKELGSEPGINSTMGLDISIALRPDTKWKIWPWSGPFIK
jgi:hypothetical protein